MDLVIKSYKTTPTVIHWQKRCRGW